MRDPLGVRTAGAFDVVCQIVHIKPRTGGTVIDIVTLEPCRRDEQELPAGTALALGFGSDPTEPARSSIESAMTLWETTCAPLRLQVDDDAKGVRYRFSGAGRSLTVLVKDHPDLPPGVR